MLLGVFDSERVEEGLSVALGVAVGDTVGDAVGAAVEDGVAGAEGVTEGVGVCEGAQEIETMETKPSQAEQVHTIPQSSRVQQGSGRGSGIACKREVSKKLLPPPPPLASL